MVSNRARRHIPRDREMGSQKFISVAEQHLERIALEFESQESERDTTMKTTTKNTGIKVNAGVKAGSISANHTRPGLTVKAGLKAGYICKDNHNLPSLKIV